MVTIIELLVVDVLFVVGVVSSRSQALPAPLPRALPGVPHPLPEGGPALEPTLSERRPLALLLPPFSSSRFVAAQCLRSGCYANVCREGWFGLEPITCIDIVVNDWLHKSSTCSPSNNALAVVDIILQRHVFCSVSLLLIQVVCLCHRLMRSLAISIATLAVPCVPFQPHTNKSGRRRQSTQSCAKPLLTAIPPSENIHPTNHTNTTNISDNITNCNSNNDDNSNSNEHPRGCLPPRDGRGAPGRAALRASCVTTYTITR